MNEYYVSLVKFFLDSFLKVVAEDEIIVRKYLNKELKGLWCSVYSKEEYDRSVSKYGGELIGKTVTLAVEDGTIYDNY